MHGPKIFNSTTFTTWISFLIKFGGWLILMPLILSEFDSQTVSIWLIFQTIGSILLIFDLGFAQTFTRAFSYCFGGAQELELDYKGHLRIGESSNKINGKLLKSLYGTSKRLYFGIAIVGFFGILTIGLYSLETSISQINSSEILLTLLIMGCCSAVKLFGNLYISVLTGSGRLVVVNNWESLFGCLNLISSIILFLSIPNIYYLIINQQFWYVLSVLRNFFLVRKIFQGFKGASFEKNIFGLVFNSAWKSSLGIIFGFGTIQIASLMLARFETPNVVASYLLALRIINLISDFSRAPFYSKIPELSQLFAKGSIENLLSIAGKGMRNSLIVFTVGVIFVSVFHDILLELINSDTKFVEYKIWTLLAIGYFIERYGAIQIQLYSITNHITWHISNGITGVIFIFGLLFYPLAGLIVFPLSILISNLLFYCPYNASMVGRYYRLNWWSYNLSTSVPPFIILLCYMLIYSIL